jgi:hypothetical protein
VGWRTPLQLAAALHYLVLGGEASWDDVDGALDGHVEFIGRFVAEQPVQTNEVQRSWMLLPCFLEIARHAAVSEFDLIELGPSAGLNLVWDRYRYRYSAGSWGRPGAPLELGGEERRPVPADLLGIDVRVSKRIGVDAAPIDVTTDDGARLLKAFVWADQTWRLEQLDRAIEALREDPPELVRGDAVAELPGLLASASDRLTVVLQTAVFGYIGAEGAERIYETLDDAAARRPLAYVGSHQPGPDVHTYWALAVRVWPGERETVAHADFHGAWIEWL